MPRSNALLQAPPYPVEKGLKRLGQNLRVARIRRELTIDHVAQKIGTGRRAVMDAEKGMPATGVAVYAALLWAYDLFSTFEELANPMKDEQGAAFEARRARTRVRKSGDLDNDF